MEQGIFNIMIVCLGGRVMSATSRAATIEVRTVIEMDNTASPIPRSMANKRLLEWVKIA